MGQKQHADEDSASSDDCLFRLTIFETWNRVQVHVFQIPGLCDSSACLAGILMGQKQHADEDSASSDDCLFRLTIFRDVESGSGTRVSDTGPVRLVSLPRRDPDWAKAACRRNRN